MDSILLSWSGGKDSSMALWQERKAGRNRIEGILTTVTEGYERISIHGVRRDLLEMQAESVGLPLHVVTIPQDSDNRTYEERMRRVLLQSASESGISGVSFGDLFLEDIRKYREGRLGEIGMKAHFPLWKMDTGRLARRFIELGFRAIVCCVDTDLLDGSFCGAEYDEAFLRALPKSVDPCGENGEFHTFAYDGPIFTRPLVAVRGEKVLRMDRFLYCDLLPSHVAHGV